MSSEERQLADALLERLKEAFGNNEQLNSFLKELQSGSASMDTARRYAKALGGIASEIFREYAQAFVGAADGYEAAMEALWATFTSAADYAAQAQSLDNQRNGIRIRGQKADFDKAKASGIAHNVSNALDAAAAVKAVDGPVQTFTEGTIPDTIEKNASFNQDAGFREYVERSGGGKCCPWCESLCGRFEYGKQPKDFFRQHANCTCTFRHFSERGTIKKWSGAKGKKQIALLRQEENQLKGKDLEQRINETVAASPIFVNKSDLLYQNSKKIKPIKGYEDIVIHGDEDSFAFKDLNDNRVKRCRTSAGACSGTRSGT